MSVVAGRHAIHGQAGPAVRNRHLGGDGRAQALHLQLVTIPPGGRARAHKHASHETAIYALTGTSAVWHGARLEHHSVVKPGDFFYIPADVPHLPYNPSATETVVAVIARSDPHEQESVVLLPELESAHPA